MRRSHKQGTMPQILSIQHQGFLRPIPACRQCLKTFSLCHHIQSSHACFPVWCIHLTICQWSSTTLSHIIRSPTRLFSFKRFLLFYGEHRWCRETIKSQWSFISSSKSLLLMKFLMSGELFNPSDDFIWICFEPQFVCCNEKRLPVFLNFEQRFNHCSCNENSSIL